ncbi:PGF-pre-PGF domain-containing protein [Candidatus Woesearchaeota archaeon]|nr:PGF-pre-PGF domain-containing protein [Candidatus Woesearchaeota archaeon]
MKNKFIIGLCIFLLIVPLSLAYEKVEMVRRGTDLVQGMNYCSLIGAYSDSGGSCDEDIAIRVYSDSLDELNDNHFLGVLYSDKALKNYVLITPKGGALVDFQTMGDEIKEKDGLFYRDIDVTFDTEKARFPGIVSVVISGDTQISSDDVLVEVEPEDGWLIGADGGEPCVKLNGYWLIDESCQNYPYSSFDIEKEIVGNDVYLTVTDAYWKSGETAVPIDVDSRYIVVELRKDNFMLDSAVVGLDEKVRLSGVTGELYVYVNGIKEGEISVAGVDGPVTETPGSVTETGKSSIPIINRVDFDLGNAVSLTKYSVFLKDMPEFFEGSFDVYDDVPEDLLYVEALMPLTNIRNSNIDLIRVEFRVSQQWLLDNSLDISDVNLYVVDRRELVSIPVSVLKEDIDYVYFTAELEETLPFVIGKIVPQVEVQGLSSDIKKPSLSYPIDFQETNSEFLYVIALLVVLAITIYIMHLKQK